MGVCLINPVKVALVGIEDRELLDFLIGYSWHPRLHVGDNPSKEWLEEEADIFLLNGSMNTIYDLLLRIKKPVILYGEPHYVENLQDLSSWPAWVIYPSRAPLVLLVALGQQLLRQERHLEELKYSLEKTKNKLEERILIEQAKGVLMEHLDITESEAYQRMRNSAMKERKSVRDIAQTIMMFSEMRSPNP